MASEASTITAGQDWDWTELYLDRPLSTAEVGAAIAGALRLEVHEVQAVTDIARVNLATRPRLVARLTPMLGEFPLRVEFFRHDHARLSNLNGKAVVEAFLATTQAWSLVDGGGTAAPQCFILAGPGGEARPVALDPEAMDADPPVLRLARRL
ncbi:MAG: hypothetical protein JSR45_12275 [Proteobacteria bacterium]|nr:hypothetical protein [Pseudomonadota bacterium]